MAYIGNAPVLQSTEFREEFFPTSNQTAFITGGFHPSAVSVTRNGVLLSESDYTKGSDNVTITLNSAAISGDVVVIRGNRSLAQGVSVSESRVEHTWQSGDTLVQLNADVIPAYTDVYLNGVKLAAADYSINASTKQVSFTSAPAVGDVIAVVHKNETSALVGLPIKDSYGNEVLSQSGNAVSIGTLRLPTSGGIQDSSGANVLTEASGTVTLTADAAVLEGSSSGDLVRITQTGSGNALVVEDSTNPDSTPFVVTSNGKLLVGTSTARSNLFNAGITSQQQVETLGGSTVECLAVRNANDTTGADLVLAKSRGTAIGSNTIVQSGDRVGTIAFMGSDGSEFVPAARINAEVDGTPGTDDMPGRLVFSTTKDGASIPTEAMRIDSNQSVQIKNNSSSDALRITQTGTGNALVVEDSANPDSTPFVVDANGNVGIGKIPSERLDVVVNATANSRIHTDLGGTNAKYVSLNIDSSETYDDSRAQLNFRHAGTEGATIFTSYRTASGITDGLVFRTFDASPIIFTPNNSEAMRIDSSGNLLVGDTETGYNSRILLKSPGSTSSTSAIYALNSSNTLIFQVRSDGLFSTGTASYSPYNYTTGGSANVVVDSNGHFLRVVSSIKYKTDVEDATHGLAEVLQLRPVIYKSKNDGDKVFGGLIAEEVHEVGLIEFVQYAEDGSPDALHYSSMVSLAFKAIQEQQIIIESQQSQIDALTARIEALEATP